MRKDLYADLYSLEEQHWWHISKRRAAVSCVRKFLKKPNAIILDIGCGTGKNMKELQKFGDVYGLDSSTEALSFCRKRGLKNVKLGKAENMPFKSNSFDLITLLDVLEHTNDNRTLREMHRVLRKDGLLILTVPAYEWLWSRWDEILNHKRRYNRNHLVSILKKHNFNTIYATYLYSFLVFPVFITRQIKQKLLQRNNYSSDFKLSNSLLNKIIDLMSKIEFKVAQRIPISFGTTILAVAKKSYV